MWLFRMDLSGPVVPTAPTESELPCETRTLFLPKVLPKRASALYFLQAFSPESSPKKSKFAKCIDKLKPLSYSERGSKAIIKRVLDARELRRYSSKPSILLHFPRYGQPCTLMNSPPGFEQPQVSEHNIRADHPLPQPREHMVGESKNPQKHLHRQL